MNTTATTATAFAAVLFCCGFSELPQPQRATCPYTKQVIDVHAPVEARAGTDQVSPASAPLTPSAQYAPERGRFLNLCLSELAWKPAALFAKLLAWEGTSELQEKLAHWSDLVVVSPIRWFTGVARHAIGVAAAPVIALAPSKTPAETTVMASDDAESMKRKRHVIMDGRLPSLAWSMGSSLDPAMGLDDVTRNGQSDLQVGLRLERAFDTSHGNGPLEFYVLVPGF